MGEFEVVWVSGSDGAVRGGVRLEKGERKQRLSFSTARMVAAATIRGGCGGSSYAQHCVFCYMAWLGEEL